MEPNLMELKSKMFEELKAEIANDILERRAIGYSLIRLMPKAHGFRPIMNLRRRVPIRQAGRLALGRSINSVLKPIHSILDYEKVGNETLRRLSRPLIIE